MTIQQTIVLLNVIAWPTVAAIALGAIAALLRSVCLPRGTIARLVAAQALLEAQAKDVADLRTRVERVERTESAQTPGWTSGMGR